MFTCYFACGFKKNKVNVRRFLNYFPFIVITLLAGCSSDPGPAKSDQDYLPLQVGQYQIYDVDETQYTAANPPQELHYQLKTVVVDSFANAGGNFTYVIFRYTRDDGSQPWQYVDTWSARKDDARAIVSEGNTEFVKLSFPLQNNKKWDGNEFNSQDEEDYMTSAKGLPCTLGDAAFDDCIKIIQRDLDDVIVMTDKRSETYARGVGLVLREKTILNFCTSGCQQFGEIENGIEYTQTISEYGME